MHRPPLAAVLVMAAALLTGCASGDDDWSQRRPSPSAVGALGAGFIGQDTSPAPESTVTPRPGSWSEVRPAAGTRVVLLSAGSDRPTKTLVKAVKAWADGADVDLRTETASGDADLLPAVIRALDLHPDLVISAGNDLIDPLTTVSPSHLAQDFLVVGAELAEPTENVTAVDWTGASYRGEGLGMSSTYDPASFTDARCAAAVRAGAAAVLTGHTGIVVWLDDH
uniref:BMP family ABC transporter substrate-binding protein n=1 Tax=Streptomyces sp. NBC_01401 TaxID=2903854 RepID=A0AAU3GS21_9ACTN